MRKHRFLPDLDAPLTVGFWRQPAPCAEDGIDWAEGARRVSAGSDKYPAVRNPASAAADGGSIEKASRLQ